jgi:hypothetical protein
MFQLLSLLTLAFVAIAAFAVWVYFTKGPKALAADETAVETAAKDLQTGNVAGAISTVETIQK